MVCQEYCHHHTKHAAECLADERFPLVTAPSGLWPARRRRSEIAGNGFGLVTAAVTLCHNGLKSLRSIAGSAGNTSAKKKKSLLFYKVQRWKVKRDSAQEGIIADLKPFRAAARAALPQWQWKKIKTWRNKSQWVFFFSLSLTKLPMLKLTLLVFHCFGPPSLAKLSSEQLSQVVLEGSFNLFIW